ncbi:MAG: AbgT family transporter, partial [Gammaproteobacteria bacterium]
MAADPKALSGPGWLDRVERVGNRLPDPALLFLLLLVVVWVASALLSQIDYQAIDPRTGEPLRVQNLLTGSSLVAFASGMVGTFGNFHPLGVVLVARLG